MQPFMQLDASAVISSSSARVYLHLYLRVRGLPPQRFYKWRRENLGEALDDDDDDDNPNTVSLAFVCVCV